VRNRLRIPANGLNSSLFLGGAAVLLVVSIWRLPLFPDIVHAPATPFDQTDSTVALEYRLLQEAAALIPEGVSVSVVSAPRDFTRETRLHREAVALLPGRKVIPAAVWNTPTYADEQAEFLIVAGSPHARERGTALLDTPFGSVWRRPAL
jgi:hypothetical protein